MSIRTDIIELLESPAVTHTHFRLFGFEINGRDYRRIATAIRNGHIQVIRSSQMPSTVAAYQRRLNCFTVGSNPSDSLLVHEATHAINDWHGRSIRSTLDEGLAYVAQMVYFCRRHPAVQQQALTERARQLAAQQSTTCGTNARRCNDGTITYATIIAATLRTGGAPSAELLRQYQQALAADSFTVNPTGTRTYDHVRRVEIPLDYLVEVGGEVIAD